MWLAATDRLPTAAQMATWNGNSAGTCMLCLSHLESRDHLFFECSYAAEVWEATAKVLFHTHYSTNWSMLLAFISLPHKDHIDAFLLRYVFQTVVYTIWRERNGRLHGDASHTTATIISWVDRQVKNQLQTIRRSGDRKYDEGFQRWLQARS